MEHYHRLTATISDLIMGNTYKFRVFSENKVGISEEAIVTSTEASITKTGIYSLLAFGFSNIGILYIPDFLIHLIAYHP